jgi:hypothetical protein
MPVAEATNSPEPRRQEDCEFQSAQAHRQHIGPRGRQCLPKDFSDGEIRGVSYVCDGKNHHHELQDGKTEAKKSLHRTPNIVVRVSQSKQAEFAGCCDFTCL